MSFILNMFRSPPKDDGEKEEQRKDESPVDAVGTVNVTEKNVNVNVNVEEGPPVDNAVFLQSLPDLNDMYADMVEWLCHTIVLYDGYEKYKRSLEDLLQASGSQQTTTERVTSRPRLLTRLRLTAIYIDMASRHVGSAPDEEELMDTSQGHGPSDVKARRFTKYADPDANAIVPPSPSTTFWELSSSEWALIKERLKEVYSLLGQPDQNQKEQEQEDFAFTQQPDPSEPKTTSNFELAECQEFSTILYLLEIQQALASLKEELQDVAVKRPVPIKPAVERELHKFERNVKRIIQQQEERTFNSSPTSMGSLSFAIPDEFQSLTSGVLHDNPPSQWIGAALEEIMAICFQDDHTFSLTNLKNKVRKITGLYRLITVEFFKNPIPHSRKSSKTLSLLRDWSISKLEVPILYRLGYGGVGAAAVVAAEEANVDDITSIFGDEGVRTSATRVGEGEENQRRTTSFGSVGSFFRNRKRSVSNLDDDILLKGIARDVPADEVPAEASKRLRTKESIKEMNGDIESLSAADDDEDSVESQQLMTQAAERPDLPRKSPRRHAQVQEPDKGPEQDKVDNSEEKGDLKQDDDSTVDPDEAAAGNPNDRPDGGDRSPGDQPIRGRRLNWSDESSVDDENFDSPSRNRKLQRRKKFTQEEVQAIKEGVEKYGVGKWKAIKDNSGGRLDNRSTVQIKDKYRTLLRTNQI